MSAPNFRSTRARDEVIDFSITCYTDGQPLLEKPGSRIYSIKGLGGKQVSVQQGPMLEKTMVEVAPDAEVVCFKEYNPAWPARRQGRVDALTGSLNILQEFTKGYDFEIVETSFDAERDVKARLVGGEEVEEAMQAFAERRSPDFTAIAKPT